MADKPLRRTLTQRGDKAKPAEEEKKSKPTEVKKDADK